MKVKLTGLVLFPDSLWCSSEVLDSVINARIGGIPVQLAFPRKLERKNADGEVFDGIFNSLASPRGAEKWKIGGSDIGWGHTHFDGTSEIRRVVIFSECSEENVKSTAKALYSDVGRWERAFLEYCYIISRQNPIVQNSFYTIGCKFQLCAEKPIYMVSPDVNPPTCPLPFEVLSAGEIREACEFASKDTSLLLEYQLLNEAYSAFINGKNRQAIMDACSALEIVMVKQIRKYCKSLNLDEEILLSKYQSLGERVRLVQKLYTSFFIDNLVRNTVYLRNAVAHSNTVYPSNEETDRLIDNVEKAMKFFHDGYY